MKNNQKDVSWVIVRTIGLLLVVHSLSFLIPAIGGMYVASSLKEYNKIIIQSSVPVATNNLDNPINRQLHKANMDARLMVKSNSFLFLITIVAGVYCLRRGYLVYKLISYTANSSIKYNDGVAAEPNNSSVNEKGE